MKNLLSTSFFFFVAFYSIAGNFTPGNIVVIRTGTGSASLTSAATACFLDEYTTSGTLVQSIAIPTTDGGGNYACTMSGTASTEGQLFLSPNNRYLAFAGFDTTAGATKVTSSIVNRIVGIVDSTGNVNTSNGFTADGAYSGNNFRAAVTNDGSGFWCAGADTSNSGTYYVSAGSLGAGVPLGSTVTSAHNIEIFGGQLYFSTGSGTSGIYTLGSGLPTSSDQVENILPLDTGTSFPSSPFGFWFFNEGSSSAYNVLYVCDDTTGLYKYSLMNGVWIANGMIANSSGIEGITGVRSCSSVTLYITAGTGIYTLTDTAGYNQTITGTFTQIATASTNEVIRGIAFTPGSNTTSPPVLVFNDSLPGAVGDSNGSIALTVTGGNPPYTYNWSTGATTQNVSNLPGGSYSVTVTDNNCNTTIQSTSLYGTGISETSWMNKFNVSVSGENLYVNATMNTELNCSISLYDLAGRVILSQPPVRTSVLALQIPVGQISSGCYFLRMVTEQGAVSRKVIIAQ